MRRHLQSETESATEAAAAAGPEIGRAGLSLLRHPVHCLALGFGVGLVPRMPGTAGTLLAVIPGWWMLSLPMPGRIAMVAGLTLAGIWICGESSRRLGTHDHSAIVWDEIVGFLAVTLVLPPEPQWWIAAFVLFRLFDIAKPWPVGWLDRRVGGGLGIVLDDLAAAGLAAACLMVAKLVFV